jgi:hypothetical protein
VLGCDCGCGGVAGDECDLCITVLCVASSMENLCGVGDIFDLSVFISVEGDLFLDRFFRL